MNSQLPTLHVFRDPALDGPTNMARDEHLLYSETARPAALRIYAWDPPTISLGYFQRLADVQSLPPEIRNLAVVRRATGGGAILHDRELTYCLVVDDSIEISRRAPAALYALVHEIWRQILQKSRDSHALDGYAARDAVDREIRLAPDEYPLPTPRTGPFFCFQKPGRTDLLIGADKVLGSAQRRIPGRVLQHGSLILGRRFDAHPGAHLSDPPPDRVAGWIDEFVASLAERLQLSALAAEWTAPALEDVARRREKFGCAAWTAVR